MPLVTINLLETVTTSEQAAIADGIHQAIVAAGFPTSDRFQRIFTFPAERFRFDDRHPNLVEPRSDRFVLIEMLLSAGRTVEFKRGLLENIVENLARTPGIEAHDIMVVFIETARENWSFASGIQTYVETVR